jgi:lipooligosaccharide transport system permease protein
VIERPATFPPERRPWIPRLSSLVWTVWQRDFDVFRRLFWVNFAVPMLEPIFYLLALGFGLGLFVKEVQGTPYPRFLAPGLIAAAIMFAAFFECSYASFVRMYHQKTFDAIIATPVNLEEVVAGEILWGASRAVIHAAVVLVVVCLFGLASPFLLPILLPLAFLGGFLFATLGMIFTALVPSIEHFNFPYFLFITPMLLVSGVFFPLEALPLTWQRLAFLLFPLTHLVRVARALSLGRLEWSLLGNMLWMIALSLSAFYLALYLMRRRLIQ